MKPRKVLVVEDSELVHMMCEAMLEGWLIVHARDGLEALGLLDDHGDVAVILLDMNMPRMSGLEFLAKVKASKKSSNIPVIVLSTEARAELVQRAIREGAAAYLRKPLSPDVIIDALSRLTGEPPR